VWLRDPALGASWLELARQLAAAGGKVAATAAADAIVEATALADDSAAFEAVFAALHTKERTPRKQLPRVELLPPVLDALAAIADAVAQHEAHLEHAAMARLSRVLLAEYAALKRERGLVDMNDLELVGWRMLGDPVLAGWVQQRLDARIRHLLIDEFQDTSPLQWHALRSWLSAYAGAGGGEAVSVFLVGDPKQSIYRFRRAEPRVFTAATDFVRRALGGRLLACDHTRRCAPGVLAVVNGVFEPLAAAATFAGFRAHTTEVDAGAAPGDALRLLERVERSPRRPRGADPAPADWRPSLHEPRVEAEDLPREAEAARVADAVQALLAEGFGPGDILVLARRRAPLRLAAAAVLARHVACTAADDTPLGELPEVRDLVAVLDTLASPAHDLSLAQALKSPLFGADDDDLMRLASAAAGSGWWDALQALSDAEASPALRRARDLLGRWAGLAAGLPPHDLLDRIVAEGDLMARLAAAVPPERWPLARQAVRAVLRQSLLLDGGRYASVYAFVRALRRRKLVLRHDGDDDAVRLLTVHGAKGLEARAVVLMDCDPEPPSADTATLLVDWPVEHEAPRGVAFVASEARIAPSLRDALAEERAQRQREELNGLYVALTRAAERLVVSATAPARGGGASWWNLLAPLAAAASPSAPQRATLSPLLPASRVGVLPVVALAPAAVPTPRPAATVDDASARLGSAVHRLLEWLTGTAAAAGSNAHAAAQAWAPAAAQAFALPAEMAPEVARRAAVVFASADCQRFFGPGVAWAGNEVPVADAGGCARIDRLVRLDTPDGPEWWVLDYKLAHAPAAVGAYRDQLQRYRAAVQALLPGERVRAAFVTGEGGLVEIAAPDGAAGPDVN
jgi:ATP-dependent helicase/nuclease subunit A